MISWTVSSPLIVANELGPGLDAAFGRRLELGEESLHLLVIFLEQGDGIHGQVSSGGALPGGALDGRGLDSRARSRPAGAALQASRREPTPPTCGDLVVGSPGLDAAWLVLRVPSRDGVLVAPMDQQPLRPAAVRTRPVAPEAGGPDEHERAVQLLPVELELELPVVDGTGRVGGVRVGTVGAPVPDDDVARAVLAPRDDALEVEVVERMVLDVDREPPLARVEARPARDRPGREHALHLEPEVVVEGGGAMTLDDEPPRPRSALTGRSGAASPDGSGVTPKSRFDR